MTEATHVIILLWGGMLCELIKIHIILYIFYITLCGTFKYIKPW